MRSVLVRSWRQSPFIRPITSLQTRTFTQLIDENMLKPQPPQSRLTEFGINLQNSMEFSKSLIFEHMNKDEEQRQSIFLLTKELRVEITQASLQLDNGNIELARDHLNLAYEKIDVLDNMNEIRL